MTTYINPPITTDPDQLSQDAFDIIQQNVPGWVPSDSHLESWQVYALARMVGIAADVAADVPLAVFRYFGTSVIGLPSNDAVVASATTTWTMVDNQGYTIPAGTNVGYSVTGDTIVPFVVTADVVVPPGSISTAVGAVQIAALDAGAAANNLGPAGIQLIDPLAYVNTVVATGPTSGGIDAETDTAYLSRLIDYLGLQAPRPIRAPDFAVLARQIAGVTRATALDNYNPADHTFTNERMVGVAAVDASGNAVSAAIKTAIANYLAGLREPNFIINVFDPSYTNVDVHFTYTAFPGYDTAVVTSAAIDAVTAYLQPATWGVDPTDDAGTSWENDTKVRLSEISALLNTVPGLRYVESLTLNGVAADVNLAGDVALPRPGAITGAPA